MRDGGNLYHPSHNPAPPQAVGWRREMVYCRACGALLRSERGLGTAPRVFERCIPVAAGFRDAAPRDAAPHAGAASAG